MKKYPFPPGVTSMSAPDYARHCAAMGAKEREEKAAKRAHRDAMAARRREVAAAGPLGKVLALDKGASVTLTGYTKTTQLSSTLRSAYVKTGRRFESKLAHDLMHGKTVIGVTITRTT